MPVMRIAMAAVALALPAALLAGPVDAAPATYKDPQVQWAGNVHVDGDTATVLAKYRCWGGNNEATHLWVSLKQGGGIDDFTAAELAEMEGTSGIAEAWYDTNVTGDTALNCNGKWHVQRYTVAREFGTLKRGSAWLQFCLFDSTSTDNNFPQGFAYAYPKVNVHP